MYFGKESFLLTFYDVNHTVFKSLRHIHTKGGQSHSNENKSHAFISIFTGDRGIDGKGGTGGKKAKHGNNCIIKRLHVSYSIFLNLKIRFGSEFKLNFIFD